MLFKVKNLFVVLLIASVLSCKNKNKNTDVDTSKLGVVEFQVTGNQLAQDYFEKGLLLLHSFEYEDAREEFLLAQKADPDMAMAYWGEAMTYNHSLWGQQDYKAGISAVQKAKSLQEDQEYSTIENGFLQAIDVLYTPKTSKKDRDKSYMQYMKQLHETHPDNQEIAAFYAISLLGSVPEGRDDSIYGEGAKIAQQVLEKNPKHPGALHYLIHSYDDPYHAELAFDAANSYAKVAPDASHALHMPSHIYVALGMWDEVIASNIDSYQASLNRMQRKGLDNNARGFHAFHWLQYGYLQKGDFEKARQMVLDMTQYLKETPNNRIKNYLVFLKGTYLVETNQWNSDIANIEVDVSNLNLTIQSQYYFIEGYRAYLDGDLEKVTQTMDTMSQKIEKESIWVSNLDSGFSMCATVSRDTPTKMDLMQSQIMLMQVKALKAWMEQDVQKTEELLKESTIQEQAISYSYGPPVIIKPTSELYAEWLMEQNRFDEAIEQYNATLERATKRRLAVEGIEKATRQKV
ncbi:hypothetical protein OS188_05955 [Xanthomarina sp. F1114]|uniref:tetratricopeptide repeat protein n=1 Tax=Xanthomarina sp. F1114 TaxID=2996019 RepID=UPI00225DFB86|nr:hypothetical protein [Xanthomarina sp. F1114]MCX7547496.1 hypothetical protein [Xanthomarina sp. F1114]